ncbi:MAG: hypothetical protein E3J21_10810 [Anaerolineales bacterium]|nr:MAG: hypothetical protein E3J21_10810 [Anaerolineales bacterium]
MWYAIGDVFTGLQLTGQLSDAIPCALTAVFSAAQTYLACEEMAEHKLSALVIEEFARAAAGQTKA